MNTAANVHSSSDAVAVMVKLQWRCSYRSGAVAMTAKFQWWCSYRSGAVALLMKLQWRAVQLQWRWVSETVRLQKRCSCSDGEVAVMVQLQKRCSCIADEVTVTVQLQWRWSCIDGGVTKVVQLQWRWSCSDYAVTEAVHLQWRCSCSDGEVAVTVHFQPYCSTAASSGIHGKQNIHAIEACMSQHLNTGIGRMNSNCTPSRDDVNVKTLEKLWLGQTLSALGTTSWEGGEIFP